MDPKGNHEIFYDVRDCMFMIYVFTYLMGSL